MVGEFGQAPIGNGGCAQHQLHHPVEPMQTQRVASVGGTHHGHLDGVHTGGADSDRNPADQGDGDRLALDGLRFEITGRVLVSGAAQVRDELVDAPFALLHDDTIWKRLTLFDEVLDGCGSPEQGGGVGQHGCVVGLGIGPDSDGGITGRGD